MKPMFGKKSASNDARGRGGATGAALRVLFDGWSLVYDPAGAAAFHLLALLEALPAGVEAVAILPGPSPHILPGEVELARVPFPGGSLNHLRWEQRVLSPAGVKAGVDLLHLVASHPPLATSLPVVVSPAEIPQPHSRTTPASERLRSALALGAAGNVRALLWPADLPAPDRAGAVLLPPVAHPAFNQLSPARIDLPDSYILYHGPIREAVLLQLMEGWTWASAAIGQDAPLLLGGLGGAEQRQVDTLVAQAGLEGTVVTIPAATLEDWAALYRQASLVVTLGPEPPWGGVALQAMAAGKPLIGIDEPNTSQRVGPAAYLVPPGDARALGAAMTTLVVESELAAGLGQAAKERAQGWKSASFGRKLLAEYRRVLAEGG